MGKTMPLLPSEIVHLEKIGRVGVLALTGGGDTRPDAGQLWPRSRGGGGGGDTILAYPGGGDIGEYLAYVGPGTDDVAWATVDVPEVVTMYATAYGADTNLTTGAQWYQEPVGTISRTPVSAFTRNADGSITVTYAGVYQLAAMVVRKTGTQGAYASIATAPNVEGVIRGSMPPAATNYAAMIQLAGLMELTAGQTIYVNGMANPGGAVGFVSQFSARGILT